MEQPISVANVTLLDPIKKYNYNIYIYIYYYYYYYYYYNIYYCYCYYFREPTKVKWGWIEETATGIIRKARISKLSNTEIPKPEVPKRIRKTGPFDTLPTVVHQQTFYPSLAKPPIPEDCQL